MFEIIITLFGIAASALCVGYVAFAIHAVLLWVIVIATFALMIRHRCRIPNDKRRRWSNRQAIARPS